MTIILTKFRTMKNLFLTLLFSTFILSSIAQNYLTLVKPMGSKEWGYVNQEGAFVIDAKYRKCYSFSDGLAAIYEQKQYSFLRPDGSLMTPEVKGFKLHSVFGFGLQGFSEGMVQVSKDGKWGYLNKEGKLAIDFKYTFASKFDNGVAIVKIEDAFYVVDKNGVETLIKIDNLKKVLPFSEGLAPYHTIDKMVGFIGPDGNVVIEPKFFSVGYFVNGLAWAKKADKSIGFIDKSGNWVIEPTFLSAKDFDKVSGMARVKVADKWAYVNTEGKVTYVNSTLVWGDFSDGLAKGKQGDKWGFYDNSGYWVIPPKYEGVRDFKNGFASAKLDDKWGVIDPKGEWVIKPQFANINDMELIE